MAAPLKVCVCGGGNGAHVLAGLAASCTDVETRVLALQNDEAEKWTNEITVVINENNGSSREVKSKPSLVTKDPKEAVSGSDIVLLVVPAHAHRVYLDAVKDHLGKNTLIVGLPGRPGFEFLCWNILGNGVYTMMSFEALPWECKIVEYGKKVEILATKQFLSGAMTRGRGVCRRPPLMSLQMLHGKEPLFRQTRNFLEVILSPFSYITAAITYGQWKDWDGKPVTEAPLFYENISKETANILASCNKECLAIAEAIKTAKSIDQIFVHDLGTWLKENYLSDITETKDVHKMIQSNKSFKGIKHQMKESKKSGMEPDLESVLTEEVSNGLVVVKGLAVIAGVDVPTVTMLLEWGQGKLGKQFLKDGQLAGKDIESTTCPQRFGFTTLDEVLTGKKEEQDEAAAALS